MSHPERRLPSIGFVSTYPSTECGLATFTDSLRGGMAKVRGTEVGLGVISLVDYRTGSTRSEVVYEHLSGDRLSLHRTVDILNTHDVALFQHEYGIYGGEDGVEILEIVSRVAVPTVVTLHTVPVNPTRNQQMILETLVNDADRTIVMSQAGAGRLKGRYKVAPEKINVIPHGANPDLAGPRPVNEERPVVLTWGLIGPSKGLETAIQAFAALKDLRPQPRFIVLGRTHPKVLAAHGDVYLRGLMARVEELGIAHLVEFDGRYLDNDSLIRTIRGVDIVLIPYDSTEQATSGVLVEAIAAGKPVIATAFPHATEMLETGAGVIVPHRNPEAMSAALRSLLTDPKLATRMADVARSMASTLFWPAVAARYEAIVGGLVAEAPIEDMARIS